MESHLLVATRNEGKIRELEAMLSPAKVKLVGLSAFPEVPTIVETGRSFTENAALKASGYALATGHYALADDSGLEIDALAGKPGIFSARYGGEGLSDQERCEVVLEEMRSIPVSQRRARFICSIAFASPAGLIKFSGDGKIAGFIAKKAAGSGGFGYDPIFVPDGYDRSFAELPSHVKEEISHRSRAMRLFMRFLLDFTGV